MRQKTVVRKTQDDRRHEPDVLRWELDEEMGNDKDADSEDRMSVVAPFRLAPLLLRLRPRMKPSQTLPQSEQLRPDC